MIELLLLVQTITTAVLAALVVKLRRELYPTFATAGSVDVGFWIRGSNVLIVAGPQFEVSKTVIRTRWLTSEELFLKYSIRVYDVAMKPTRTFYKEWKAWLGGDRRYDCRVKKPRGLARLYSKAIDVVCFEREEEKPPKDVIIPPKWIRKRGKRIIKVY
jgi:hypothetical protein